MYVWLQVVLWRVQVAATMSRFFGRLLVAPVSSAQLNGVQNALVGGVFRSMGRRQTRRNCGGFWARVFPPLSPLHPLVVHVRTYEAPERKECSFSVINTRL